MFKYIALARAFELETQGFTSPLPGSFGLPFSVRRCENMVGVNMVLAVYIYIYIYECTYIYIYTYNIIYKEFV